MGVATKLKSKKKYDQSLHFEWLEFECGPKEAKQRIEELQATGYLIDRYEFEPTTYKYRLKYIAPKITKDQLKNEIWRDIPGKFFGMYQVSNFKRVRRLRILADYASTNLLDNEGNKHNVKVDRLYSIAFNNKK